MTIIDQNELNYNNLNIDIAKQNNTNQTMLVPNDTDIIVECNTLDENIFTYVLQLRLKHKKNCGIFFNVKTELEGKRLITMGNRLEIPIVVSISDRKVFNNLFQFWLEWKQLTIPVYPFSTIVQIYTARLIGKDFDPFIDVFFKHSNVDQLFIDDAMEHLHKSNILKDCLRLVFDILDCKYEAKQSLKL